MGKKRIRIDLTGLKFNRLTVIAYSHKNTNNQTYWKCVCDCGNEIVTIGAGLRRGTSKSCGCYRVDRLKARSLPKGEASRNAAVYKHKKDSKKRGIEQTLTDEQILVLHKDNCHYCGTPPSNILSAKDYNGEYVYNGIDRVDSDKGYQIGNVVTCCKICNYAKGTLTYDEFLSHIKRIQLNLDL